MHSGIIRGRRPVSDAAPLKALSLETKALIIVSEFEARRMPMFQMRAVFAAIVRDDEERKSVIDLVEKDLRATGYPDQQVGTFLSDLLASGAQPVPPEMNQSVQSTRPPPFAVSPWDSNPGTLLRRRDRHRRMSHLVRVRRARPGSIPLRFPHRRSRRAAR